MLRKVKTLFYTKETAHPELWIHTLVFGNLVKKIKIATLLYIKRHHLPKAYRILGRDAKNLEPHRFNNIYGTIGIYQKTHCS